MRWTCNFRVLHHCPVIHKVFISTKRPKWFGEDTVPWDLELEELFRCWVIANLRKCAEQFIREIWTGYRLSSRQVAPPYSYLTHFNSYWTIGEVFLYNKDAKNMRDIYRPAWLFRMWQEFTVLMVLLAVETEVFLRRIGLLGSWNRRQSSWAKRSLPCRRKSENPHTPNSPTLQKLHPCRLCVSYRLCMTM